jgi:hypothetical protein
VEFTFAAVDKTAYAAEGTTAAYSKIEIFPKRNHGLLDAYIALWGWCVGDFASCTGLCGASKYGRGLSICVNYDK